MSEVSLERRNSAFEDHHEQKHSSLYKRESTSTNVQRHEGSPLLDPNDPAVLEVAAPHEADDSTPETNTGAPVASPESTYDDPIERASMKLDRKLPVYYRAVLTTISVFMGYSGMIVLQDKLKTRLGIVSGTSDAYVFGVAVSFLYLGNLIFRLMHNIIFSFLKPRQRVMISYCSMTVAALTLVIPYFVFDVKHLVFVFIAYLVSGVGIGTFESNLISCLTPLGHHTKSWAVVGIPLGFNFISIGSFIVFAIWPESEALQAGVYFFIAAMNLIGLTVYVLYIPNVEYEGTITSISVFWEDVKKFRQWLPTMWRHCLGLMIDMFCVSIFAAIALYIFDVPDVPLWPKSETHIPKNIFLSIYYTLSFCGDFFSRRIAYGGHLHNPLFYLVLSVIGAGLVLSKTALLAPLGMFCVMFANGSIYAQTTKYVDIHVDKQFNLMALSLWLFIGDIGSFVGAQITQPLNSFIGTVPLPLNGTTAAVNASMTSSAASTPITMLMQYLSK